MCAYLLAAVYAAIYPVARTFFRAEITYNEGWNVYNASAVAHHQMLYPASYGWTMVNYPMLSFAIVAQLHRVTHDYLFTGRVLCLLSALACCALVGCIVRRVTGSAWAAWIAAAYCVVIFCAEADAYVGQDDPEMLALMVFLAGLLLYMGRRDSWMALAGVAGLFVIAGNIKHDAIGFPLAVAADLLLRSWRRALWFLAWGVALAAGSVWLNCHFGGPGFVMQLLAPRAFSMEKAWMQALEVFGPMLLPLCAAVYAAIALRKDDRVRVLSFLLLAGLILGLLFAGGHGVSVNAQFTALLSIAIFVGIFLDQVGRGQWMWAGARMRRYAAAMLLAWMVIPLIVFHTWNPVTRLRETVASQAHFEQEAAFVRARTGPALCESLLLCYFADKPYEYDPFNATRLIWAHKLEDGGIVQAIEQQRYGAIQLDVGVDPETRSDRFDAKMLAAIHKAYVAARADSDVTIYVPRAAGR